MEKAHRKTVKHVHDPGHLHELTFSCYRRWPLLMKDEWRQLLTESIDRAMFGHQFSLIAFVYMPEHVHLLVLPQGDSTVDVSKRISELLFAIKRPYSYRIKQLLIESNNRLLHRLTVQQRPGKMTFRYWQEGPGFDRNIFGPAAIQASINYIHNNPVRRELCERPIEWKWSSARWFSEPEKIPDSDLPRLTPLPPEWSLR
ncbi:transposase [Lacunimicrobium album]